MEMIGCVRVYIEGTQETMVEKYGLYGEKLALSSRPLICVTGVVTLTTLGCMAEVSKYCM